MHYEISNSYSFFGISNYTVCSVTFIRAGVRGGRTGRLPRATTWENKKFELVKIRKINIYSSMLFNLWFATAFLEEWHMLWWMNECLNEIYFTNLDIHVSMLYYWVYYQIGQVGLPTSVSPRATNWHLMPALMVCPIYIKKFPCSSLF